MNKPSVANRLLDNLTGRIILAIILMLVDLAVFFIPLSAVLLVYVILFRPKWFKRLVDKLYEGK